MKNPSLMRGRGALSPTEKFEINQTSDFVISSNKQYKKREPRKRKTRFLYFHPWYNVVVYLCSVLYGPYPIAIAFFSNSSMSFHVHHFGFKSSGITFHLFLSSAIVSSRDFPPRPNFLFL